VNDLFVTFVKLLKAGQVVGSVELVGPCLQRVYVPAGLHTFNALCVYVGGVLHRFSSAAPAELCNVKISLMISSLFFTEFAVIRVRFLKF